MSSPNPIMESTFGKDNTAKMVFTPPPKAFVITPPASLSLPKNKAGMITLLTSSPFIPATNPTLLTPFRNNPNNIKTPPQLIYSPIPAFSPLGTPIAKTVRDLVESVNKDRASQSNPNTPGNTTKTVPKPIPLYQMTHHGQQGLLGYWVPVPMSMLQNTVNTQQSTQQMPQYGMYPQVPPPGMNGNQQYVNYGNNMNHQYQAAPTMIGNANQWQQQMCHSPMRPRGATTPQGEPSFLNMNAFPSSNSFPNSFADSFSNSNPPPPQKVVQKSKIPTKYKKHSKTKRFGATVRDLNSEFQKLSMDSSPTKLTKEEVATKVTEADTVESPTKSKASKRYTIRTELPSFSVEMIDEHTIRFMGIYRGVDHHEQIFVLMSERHINEFNQLAALRDQTQFNNETYYCYPQDPQQIFVSRRLGISKGNTGWYVKGQLIPFNPVCVFTFDIRTNRVISMRPALMRGVINNVMPKYNSLWVTSEVRAHALEHRENMNNADMKCGRIVGVSLDDNRQRMYDLSDFNTYMVHDRAEDFQGKKGERVTFCMKLATKTNKKVNGSHRPIFVQAWNVNVDNNEQEESLAI